ncbi:hypothetical protein [Gordonia sp. NB41Y]|uniref:hypothetical protein n=1 Tax=Gordonia sp. NB41Y TaxID=875808 RepID=UPI0006C1D3B6|nr:hypothetical protein [Gordonia sp. NB41Y]KOY49183.1 hypothetical protein ISGA_11910 [Gordonia sp. NB41Y]WLP89489.1 hypothetical protein Q9K23_18170 [Gordonia sp. NB41Y]
MTVITTEIGAPRRVADRFLTPGDPEWTDDGAATWLTGHAGGLTYTCTPGRADSRLTLHNRGCGDLAVLSLPGFTGTTGTRFTHLPSGSSAALPDSEFHILQGERLDGRPVLVGQIVDDPVRADEDPIVLVHPPRPEAVDWSQMPGADEFWTPGTAPRPGRDDHRLCLADVGVHYTDVGGMVVVHNDGCARVAVLMTGIGGAFDLVVARPGERIPIPPGPGLHYVQAARHRRRPVVVDVLQVFA